MNMVLSDSSSISEVSTIIGHCICSTDSLSIRSGGEVFHMSWRIFSSLRGPTRDQRFYQVGETTSFAVLAYMDNDTRGHFLVLER